MNIISFRQRRSQFVIVVPGFWATCFRTRAFMRDHHSTSMITRHDCALILGETTHIYANLGLWHCDERYFAQQLNNNTAISDCIS